MLRTPCFSLLESILIVLCTAAACALGSARSGAAQTIDESGHPDSMLVYAADLEVHPEQYARADQILVFGMESDRNIGRFRVSKGVHRFCLEGGAGFFTQIVLLTDRGSAWPVTEAGAGCVRAKLPAGIISVLLQHGDGVRPDARATATVRVDPPFRAAASATPLVDAKNSPVGGYWLIQDDSVNARGSLGLAVHANFLFPNSPDPSVSLRGYGNNDGSIDRNFLVRFPSTDGTLTTVLPTSQDLDSQLYWTVVYSVLPPLATVDDDAYVAKFTAGPPPGVQIQDLGGYEFLAKTSSPVYGTYNLYSNPCDGCTILSRVDSGDTFQVLFRYYPDGTTVGDLRPGEVALYDRCNFRGQAVVLVPSLGPGQVSPPLDLRLLTSSYLPLNGTLKSFRVSKGTGIYWGEDVNHLQGGTLQNNSCASQSPQGNLFVEPESNVFTVALSVLPKACTGCDFSNLPLKGTSGPINLRGWDLTGARFAGVDLNNVDFSGATLTDAKFTNSSLNYVRFSGAQGAAGSIDLSGALLYKDTFSPTGLGQFVFNNAHLCGTSLHGAGPNQRLDLTIGSLTNALVQMGGDCATDPSGNPTDLSYSIFNLDVAALAERGLNWGSVNLTGARVLSPSGTVLSSANSQLMLGNVQLTGTALNGVVLDYAQGLANKDLTGIQLDGASLQHVNFKDARLYSASLQNSNLAGVNLNGAYLTNTPGQPTSAAARLDGAYLFNANLSQATLSGATFLYASFYGQSDAAANGCPVSGDFTPCATAAGATMDDANFGNAYLYGIDFSTSTAQGINFGGAYLAGANFLGARILTSITNPTSFDGASLEGANLSFAILPPSVSFSGSLFDFETNGNVITFVLDGHHTAFAGFWGTPGSPVCATMGYEQASVVPPTGSATVCPDGSSYDSGCGLGGDLPWKSNADLPANYTFDFASTFYSAAATPACNADSHWDHGPGSTLRPERAAGEIQ